MAIILSQGTSGSDLPLRTGWNSQGDWRYSRPLVDVCLSHWAEGKRGKLHLTDPQHIERYKWCIFSIPFLNSFLIYFWLHQTLKNEKTLKYISETHSEIQNCVNTNTLYTHIHTFPVSYTSGQSLRWTVFPQAHQLFWHPYLLSRHHGIWPLPVQQQQCTYLFYSFLFTSKRRQYPNLLLPSSPVKTKENISLWGMSQSKNTQINMWLR